MSDSHGPDYSKISTALRSLDWNPVDLEMTWEDGTVLLLAVPIGGPGDFRYDYDIVDISCDDGRFTVYCQGDVWGWDLEDADFYVVISV